jgi:hypothetical protein
MEISPSRRGSNESQDNFDLFHLPLEKMLDRVRYANLLLEAQISESALRTLSIEILVEKGSS